MAHGKKYLDAAKLVDHERLYSPIEAAQLAKDTTTVAFDATVEAHLRLGVDPRHADQMVRGTVVLPHGTGKVVRVAVFAQGEKALEALRAGADEVGGEDLVKKIEAGWLDFDVALATPDSMGLVGRLGKILGRRGLMPNPKAGTITFDLERAVKRGQGRPRRVQGRQERDHPRPGRQVELRGGGPRREPRRAGRRREPGPPVGRQGPVPQGPDDRQHHGPGHPGRRARRRSPRSPRRAQEPAARIGARRARSGYHTRRRSRPSGASPQPKTRRTARDSLRPRTVTLQRG